MSKSSNPSNNRTAEGAVSGTNAMGLVTPYEYIFCPNTSDFEPVFNDDGLIQMEVYYPNNTQREQFPFVHSQEVEGIQYDPLQSFTRLMHLIYEYYLTPEEQKVVRKEALFQRGQTVIRTLQNAFRSGDHELCTKVVNTIYRFMRTSKQPLSVVPGHCPEEVVVHIISEVSMLVSAGAYGPLPRDEGVYEALAPSFVFRMFQTVRLSSSDLLVVLGAGVNLLIFQAVLQSFCPAYGFEAGPDFKNLPRTTMSCMHANQSIIQTNTISELSRATVVYVSNRVCAEKDEEALKTLLIQTVPNGTRIISFRPLGMLRGSPERKEVPPIDRQLPTRRYDYPLGGVSWAKDSKGSYFIATVKRDTTNS